jgi:hypothetical protein
LKPKIIRASTDKCCKWCDNLAGIYDYPCNGAKRRNVHTHKDSDSKEDREIRIKQEQQWDKQDQIDRIVRGQIVNEVKIKGTTKHLVERAEQRSIKAEDILHAINNPLEISEITGKDNERSFKVIGEKCTLAINPDTGKIITKYKTRSVIAK